MANLNIYLLGAPRIERDGRVVKFDTRKATALIAYLAVSEQQHTRDALAALLWPEYDHKRGRAALRRTLSTINKALEGEHLEINRQTVEMIRDPSVWIDSIYFQDLIKTVADHEHPKRVVCKVCIKNLEDAVGVYKGDFLTGFSLRDSTNFDDWQFYLTDNLRQELGGCLERLVEYLSMQGSYQPAIQHAKRWLTLDPLREEAHRWLMKCYEWSGQHTASLRQYRDCVRILNEELGVSPLDETEALYASIMKRQLNLPETDNQHDISEEIVLTQTYPEGDIAQSRYPLVGRLDQLAELNRLYNNKAKNGYFVSIIGEPGIGKTRLAEEFIANAGMRRVNVLSMRSYDGESELAFSPLIDSIRTALTDEGIEKKISSLDHSWASEAARLFPELSNVMPGILMAADMEGPGAQTRFYEGLRQLILLLLQGPNPGVLFLDDFQWADEATINLLAYIIHRIGGTPVFILVTCRDSSFEQVMRLKEMLAAARRTTGGSEITLRRLSSEELSSLAEGAVEDVAKLPDNFTARLYSETEGLPLFIVEYLNLLFQSVIDEADYIYADDWILPDTVSELMSARLGAVGQIAGQIISAAAVIGRTFDFNTIQHASGRSELETLSGLEELIEHGLIIEGNNEKLTSQAIFDFSHNKIRTYAYEHTGLTRRRILHRRVAEAMIENQRVLAEFSRENSLIAQHFLKAGMESQAAEHFFQAGEDSARLYAHHEALTHYRSAISANHPEPAMIHERIGDILTLLGEYQEAIHSYEGSAAVTSPQKLPIIEVKLGNIHHRMGDYELAICYFNNALDEISSIKTTDEKNHVLHSLLLADWSRSEHQLGHSDEAQAKAEQALSIAETAQDSQALAKAHNMLGILARNRQNFTEARRQLESSLIYSKEIKIQEAEIAALNNLGLVSAEVGDIEEAIEYTSSALKICEKIGDRHRSAALFNHLADLYHRSGQPERAMEYLKMAVKIFGDIDDRKSPPKPQIWMLMEW